MKKRFLLSIIHQAKYEQFSFDSLPHNDQNEVDLHRPYIDKIVFSCEQCQAPMKRVTDVLDCWFESGAMPYAQKAEKKKQLFLPILLAGKD